MGYTIPNVNAFNMLSGIGDTFGTAYKDAKNKDEANNWFANAAAGSPQTPDPAAQGIFSRLMNGGEFPSTPSARTHGLGSVGQSSSTGSLPLLAQGYSDLGLHPTSAAALASVASAESGGRAGSQGNQSTDASGVLSGGQGAFGIHSWNGDRQTALANFSAQNGLNPRTVQAQQQFAVHEINTNPSYAASKAALNDPSLPVEQKVAVLVKNYENPAARNVAPEIARAVRSSYQVAGPAVAPSRTCGPGPNAGVPASGPYGAPNVTRGGGTVPVPTAADVIQDQSQDRNVALQQSDIPGGPNTPDAPSSPPVSPTAPPATLPPTRGAITTQARIPPSVSPTGQVREIAPQQSFGQRLASMLGGGQVVPDGQGGYVPVTNSRVNPDGSFVASGTMAPPASPAPTPNTAAPNVAPSPGGAAPSGIPMAGSGATTTPMGQAMSGRLSEDALLRGLSSRNPYIQQQAKAYRRDDETLPQS